MRSNRLILILFLLVLSRATLEGQVLTSQPHIGIEQVPIGDDVYAFLRHLSVRGIIKDYSEAQLPLSEYEVTQFLLQVNPGKLSGAESELLQKFLKTYEHTPREVVTMFNSSDATPLFWSGIFTDSDKYLYRWFHDSTNSDLFVHAVSSVELRHKVSPTSASVVLLPYGGRFSGTLSGHVGYFMQTTNGNKYGDSALALEDPLLAHNHNFVAWTQQSFFDLTTAELTYNNDWFTGKIARESIAIGGGYQNDNVILSPNVTPFDFLSLAAHVGPVRYQSMYASLVADDTIIGSAFPIKSLAMHDLTVDLGGKFELGFTDMMVFSRRLEIAYLNPFSFLKSVEEQSADQDHDNGLLCTHLQWQIAPGFEVRGQGVLDDLLGSKIGTGWAQNKWAWQFGGMWAGAFGARDLDLSAEWIRVEPYTYSHWDNTDRFSSSGSLLGAQIGPNATSYWASARWAPSSKWTFSLQGQLVERGENVYDSTGKLIYNAGADWTIQEDSASNRSQTYLLNGRRVDVLTLTATVEFEPWRGLVLFARGTKQSVDYLSGPPVTPGVDLSGQSISLAPRVLPETLISFGARALF